jgi:hypothetical protein
VTVKNICGVMEVISHKNKKIAILNFANPVEVGGGFLRGA